jgi:type IV pilus assembly protein PilB
MRVLDRSVVKLDLDNIGLREEEMKMLKNLINLPHGVIIVTGPTGSGKTTTLYSCLNSANDIRWKIITTEDPVEYDLDGIIQCQVNEDIKVTYASLLRSILRQDPDTILVGEVRDLETAQIAIEAALTGHLVFSTLHTNDAPSAITRLLDLGIEPFLICASMEAIVAQRLVRKICAKCKTEIAPTEEMLDGDRPDPERREGQEVLLREGLPDLQQHGLQRPHGHLRDDAPHRPGEGSDHEERLDRAAAARRSGAGDEDAARIGPPGHLRRPYDDRGSGPGNAVHGLGGGV